MSGLDYVYVAVFTMLGVGAVCTLIRLVRGPSVLDRIVSLNALSVLLVSAIAVEGAIRQDDAYVGLMVTIALLGFLGPLTAARFAERRTYDRE
ncbi:multicomponent Na+:H+ antiporter subunit F [Spinactinospora alkalitolerans]|uniref:Multicomponent Na+:H+ antiporter subunit F n=1 Tax=Spinactinospora alkalitolerans TaxID=687207 RepID=A0A852TT30_9ACTN|nr:monovalent cation/H+ antiporter complex subunit F [Spinactinospora alkalitolerans]NYE46447.1 multicomponent Na+:H+ antiporter subunit F [Spinactinospora alkalitolerans]